jgi:hypothetical protein
MDTNTFGLVEAVLAVGISVAGWFTKMVWDKIGKIERNIMEIQSEFHDKYVRRDDYRNDLSEIKAMLNKIFSKLDEKADK